MTAFIDENRDTYGVEPGLRSVLPHCPVRLLVSTNVVNATPTGGRRGLAEMGSCAPEIRRVWESNFGM